MSPMEYPRYLTPSSLGLPACTGRPSCANAPPLSILHRCQERQPACRKWSAGPFSKAFRCVIVSLLKNTEGFLLVLADGIPTHPPPLVGFRSHLSNAFSFGHPFRNLLNANEFLNWSSSWNLKPTEGPSLLSKLEPVDVFFVVGSEASV